MFNKHTDPIEAYRAYYRGAKAGFAEWRHDPMPEWWKCKRAEG